VVVYSSVNRWMYRFCTDEGTGFVLASSPRAQHFETRRCSPRRSAASTSSGPSPDRFRPSLGRLRLSPGWPPPPVGSARLPVMSGRPPPSPARAGCWCCPAHPKLPAALAGLKFFCFQVKFAWIWVKFDYVTLNWTKIWLNLIILWWLCPSRRRDDLCIVVMTMYCFDDDVLLDCCDEYGLSWPMLKLVLLFAKYIL
jgi:hypothetical protein